MRPLKKVSVKGNPGSVLGGRKATSHRLLQFA